MRQCGRVVTRAPHFHVTHECASTPCRSGAAPFVVFNTVRFQLDLPLASMVAIVVWLALRSDGFARRGWSLTLGVAAGMGEIGKAGGALGVLSWNIAAMVLGATVTLAVQGRIMKRASARRRRAAR